MQAAVHTRYGPPEVLSLQEVDQPAPDDHQLLVRVHAVSLNPAEWHMRNGMLLARLMGGNGLLRPKDPIPGADFAGRVEAVGRSVTQYRPGDEVFGRHSPGGLAEYVCVSEKPIAPKPANVSFEQAAAVPVAAVTALQSLRDTGRLQPGQKVLVNGASGGVGTFTVQIAKALGAEVTGVCSTAKVDLVRSLGADHVVDYTRADFTRSGHQYDLIIDNVGKLAVAGCLRALKPGGRCVGVGYGGVGPLLEGLLLAPVASRLGSKKIVGMLAHITAKDLIVLKDLIEAGTVVPVIDRCYPFSQVVEAYRYAEAGHARAKVVMTI